jgi:hypothetical protein
MAVVTMVDEEEERGQLCITRTMMVTIIPSPERRSNTRCLKLVLAGAAVHSCLTDPPSGWRCRWRVRRWGVPRAGAWPGPPAPQSPSTTTTPLHTHAAQSLSPIHTGKHRRG